VTPAALAVAPLASEGKTPEIVTAAGTSIITEKSPYIARTSFTLAQSTVPMADWAAANGVKKVVSMVSDYAPGADAEKSFKDEFTKKGGQVLETIRFPLPTRSRTRFLFLCRPARAAFLSSNSSSAVSTRPASGSSGRAMSPTTICSTAWAMR
jgi:branched-chain amino acid transport system substrate-binding protein